MNINTNRWFLFSVITYSLCYISIILLESYWISIILSTCLVIYFNASFGLMLIGQSIYIKRCDRAFKLYKLACNTESQETIDYVSRRTKILVDPNYYVS